VASSKQRFALISEFKKRQHTPEVINGFAAQWASDALIESFGYAQCLEIMDYYFSINDSPKWQYYTYNADKLLLSKQAKEKDLAIRADLKIKAKEWLNK